jgi:hypothetical protein
VSSRAKEAAIAVSRLILENIVLDVKAEEMRRAAVERRFEELRDPDRKRDV